MRRNDDHCLEALRADVADACSLMSNARKSERERMVVRALLRCLGVAFEEHPRGQPDPASESDCRNRGSEIVAGTQEPVDVAFRAARFQIRDLVGDRKRDKQLGDREQRYRNAEAIGRR